MHPRNPYKNPPDFKEMAVKYPVFRKVVTQDLAGKIHLDFGDAAALRTLTEILFLKDFNLTVTLPADTLVPTLPSRLNYLLWIEDLLSLLPQSDPKDIHGLDIGAGASAVYPLLGVKHFNWRMTATEADQVNFDAANNNIQTNNLGDQIELIRSQDKSDIFNPIFATNGDGRKFDFTMCNPPFYTKEKQLSEEEIAGSENEIRTCGGEVEFVKKMIKESCDVPDKVKIYTVLLGHKSSLTPVKQFLSEKNVPSFVTTEFCQGKTMRWGVAWTFLPDLSLKKVLGTKAKKDKQKPFSHALEKPEGLPQCEYNSTSLYKRIKGWLEAISITVISSKESKYLCSAKIYAKKRSWQNQRRLKREGKRKNNNDDEHKNKKIATCETVAEGKYTEVDDTSEEANNRSALEESLLHEIMTANHGKAVDNIGVVQSKGESTNKDTDEALNNYVLECDMIIKWANGKVNLDMAYLEGEAGRDGVHQLCQFIKNKISSIL